MPVKVRLRRLGTKKKPFYRIVAVDSRVSTKGKILELLGHYAPVENPVKANIDIEKVDMWIKKGAQLSDTVKSVLRKAKKSQGQEKVKKKPVEEDKGKEKGKVTRKTATSTKAAQSKKDSKDKQAPKKSKKKLSRER